MPCRLTMVDEDAEVLFKPLICSFRLAVGLWVIGGADVLLDIKNMAQFLGEMGGEVGVAVSNNLMWGAVMGKYVLDI